MRQGGEQLSAALSEGKKVNAPSFCWALLASCIATIPGRPQKIRRITQTLVDHPDFPEVDPEEGARVMRQMLKQDTSFSAIPILHAAGFKLTGTYQEYELVATIVAKGQWPHVEVIVPSIFNEEACFGYLKMGLSRKEFLLNPAKMKALTQIKPSLDFGRQLSEALGYIVPYLLSDLSNSQRQNLIQTLSIYQKNGFLHKGPALRMAVSEGHEKEMRQIISEIDRHQIRSDTVKSAQPVRPRRI